MALLAGLLIYLFIYRSVGDWPMASWAVRRVTELHPSTYMVFVLFIFEDRIFF